MSTGDAYVDMEAFPEVPVEARPRSVYFRKVSALDRAALKNHGYAPVCLMELPRGTPEQEIAYLMAKMQGVEEGTVVVGDNELKALEIEMKAYNLLSQKHMVVRFNFSDRQKHKSLDDIFATWKNSRHTLRGNSTVQGMQLPEISRKELVSGQGKRPKGDTARAKAKKAKRK